jgi:hypothetical protein
MPAMLQPQLEHLEAGSLSHSGSVAFLVGAGRASQTVRQVPQKLRQLPALQVYLMRRRPPVRGRGAPKEKWFQVTYRISAFPLSACSTGTWHIRIIDSSWLCSPRTPFGRTRIEAPPFRARCIRSEASSFSRPFARPQRLPVAGSPRWGHHARPTKAELH